MAASVSGSPPPHAGVPHTPAPSSGEPLTGAAKRWGRPAGKGKPGQPLQPRDSTLAGENLTRYDAGRCVSCKSVRTSTYPICARCASTRGKPSL